MRVTGHCIEVARKGMSDCWKFVEHQEHCEQHSIASYASGFLGFAGFGAFEFVFDSILAGFRWTCPLNQLLFLVDETTRHVC